MALVLVVLLFTAWGQVHRVLHPGSLAITAAEAGQTAVPGLADEDGSGLCKLLDQLAHGAGPAAAAPAVAQAEPPRAPCFSPLVRGQPHASPGFDARGPPRFA